MPVLRTGRLAIRPFAMEDLDDVHRLFDVELGDVDTRFVPCLDAFEQPPSFAGNPPPEVPARCSTEFGLFYAVSPAHQGNGYATEAVLSHPV
jgi:hypothetical protein